MSETQMKSPSILRGFPFLIKLKIPNRLASAATATAAPATAASASKTVRAPETIKAVKAAEAEKEKTAKAAAKPAALPSLIHIVLVLIPRNGLVRMEITNIQHLKFVLEIIHDHTSEFFNIMCQQHEGA